MNIASYFSPGVIVLAFLMTIGLLLFLGRIGVIRNAFDPFMFMHLQLVFTTVLLSWAGLLPLSQVLYLVLVYLVIAACWPKSFRPSTGSDDRGWSFCVWLLVAVSVPANVFLMLTKGFILFQEDVGAAKVEFYQGVGIIRRINTVLSIVLPIYVFTSWSRRGYWSKWHTIGLLWSIFIILSLGSKAGVTSLAFSYGAVVYFRREQPSVRTTLLILLLSVVSSVSMFYLVYGDRFILDLGVRIVAFADGPFYYFAENMKIDVPFSYPFYIFAYAARMIDALPVASLGPEINWNYFRLNDDLYGPNPQISVESIAIFGGAAIFYYAVFAFFVLVFSRYVKNPYSFAVWATFLRSFPVDSQLAFSNLYNVLFVGLIFAVAIVLRKFFMLASKPVSTKGLA